MSTERPAKPKYRFHKARNLAVVRIDGKDVYLGRYDSPESRARYEVVIAGCTLARAKPAPSRPEAAPPLITVNDLALAFIKHAQMYYRGPDGRCTGELPNLKEALRPACKLYGRQPASVFGPLALRVVRDALIRSGLARKTINARIHRIRRMFRWGASIEMVPGSVVVDLETLEALKLGRSDAPETEAVKPVPLEVVEQTLPYLSGPVAAMVEVQLLSGCRAGEVAAMRWCDLQPAGDNLEYTPGAHKTAWRGHKRVIILGPRARAIAEQFQKADDTAYLFDPRDAFADRHGKAYKAPRPAKGRKVAPKGPADHYDRRSYYQAVARGCDRAFPHPTLSGVRARKLTVDQRVELRTWRREHRWSPLQLRHTTGTTIRAPFGLEAASNVLGHQKPDTTLIYAERDIARA